MNLCVWTWSRRSKSVLKTTVVVGWFLILYGMQWRSWLGVRPLWLHQAVRRKNRNINLSSYKLLDGLNKYIKNPAALKYTSSFRQNAGNLMLWTWTRFSKIFYFSNKSIGSAGPNYWNFFCKKSNSTSLPLNFTPSGIGMAPGSLVHLKFWKCSRNIIRRSISPWNQGNWKSKSS